MPLYPSNKFTREIETSLSGKLKYREATRCYTLDIAWGTIYIREEGIFFTASVKEIPYMSMVNISDMMGDIRQIAKANGMLK